MNRFGWETEMKRVPRLFRSFIVPALVVAVLGALVTIGTPASALSNPPVPVLTLSRTISSQPWLGSTGAANSAAVTKGSAYVVSDNSLWVADNSGKRIYEIDPSTGVWKRRIDAISFEGIAQLGSGGTVLSDNTRTDDFESLAYDATNDVLYVFSGNCCTKLGQVPAQPPFNPTVFRLVRDLSGAFQVESFQPLPEGQDTTGAGWRPGGGLYFGHGTKIKSYDYATNTVGSDIKISGISSAIGFGITGITFTDNATVFITTFDGKLIRYVATASSTWSPYAVPGWSFTLTCPVGCPREPHGATIVSTIAGDTIYVPDGYDFPVVGDPLAGTNHVFVYSLGSAPPPTASFTAVLTTGPAYSMQFTDTSTPLAPSGGAATSWDWNFGDGSAHSTQQSPIHQYTATGPYTVTLTASNAAGPSAPDAQSVVVTPPGSGGYVLDGFGGLHPYAVNGGQAPGPAVGGPYWNGWNAARGVSIPHNDPTWGLVGDLYGGLHPFGVGAAAPAHTISGGPYWHKWSIARSVALMPDGKSGFVLDGFGGIHPFSVDGHPAPAVAGAPYWLGWDIARGIAILPNGTGGYVLDGLGGLHPFSINGGPTPLPATGGPFVTKVAMRGVTLLGDGSGGFVVDYFGGVSAFGINNGVLPAVPTGNPAWPGWKIAQSIANL